MAHNYLNFTNNEIQCSSDSEDEGDLVRALFKNPKEDVTNRVLKKPMLVANPSAKSSKLPKSISKTPKKYPTTTEMIAAAIHALGKDNKRIGVSIIAIKNWIKATYPEASPTRIGGNFKKALQSALDAGLIIAYPKPKAEDPVLSVLKARYRLKGKTERGDSGTKEKATRPKPAPKEKSKLPVKSKLVNPKPDRHEGTTLKQVKAVKAKEMNTENEPTATKAKLVAKPTTTKAVKAKEMNTENEPTATKAKLVAKPTTTKAKLVAKPKAKDMPTSAHKPKARTSVGNAIAWRRSSRLLNAAMASGSLRRL